MLTYIAYGLLPFILFSFVMCGYIIGSWCGTTEEDQASACLMLMLFGFVAAVAAILISLAVGSATSPGIKEAVPTNLPGMLGLNVGCFSLLPIVLIIDFCKSKIDIQKSIDKKLEQLIKKRNLENEIFLKKEGL